MNSSWFDLTGRVALVTGAGANGGIGHAIALAMATYGADLLVSDIDTDGVAKTAEEIRALDRKAVPVRCDVGNPDEILAMYADLDIEFGRIDILVNNAYTGSRARPEDVSLEEWRKVFRVNLDGVFFCSQEAGRRMIRQGRGGSIVNLSSIAGSSALGRGNFVYSVTKGGINQFTRELAVEWSPYNIRVNAIQPAQTLTPAVKRMFADPRLSAGILRQRLLDGIPLGRFGEPEDIAKAAVFLASDAAGFITGHILPVDGGNLALNAGGSRIWPSDD